VIAEIQKRVAALAERRRELQQIKAALRMEAELLTEIALLEAAVRIPPHAGQGSWCGCGHCRPEQDR